MATHSVARPGVLFRTPAGMAVGELSSDGWLTKRVRRQHHLRMAGGAWAVEQQHIQQLRTINGEGIRLYVDDGRTLEATLPGFDAHGFCPPSLEPEQVVLADRYWLEVTAVCGGA